LTKGQTFLAVIILGIGGLLAAILGLFLYVSATATPMHPDPQAVSSVTNVAPAQDWRSAVERARLVTRAAISEQNLPGLSVAVGARGGLVWAEGFGWANIENRSPVNPDTAFRTGGISIALTSAAVGLLLEQNRLELDDAIQTYVPSFPEKQWPVTLRQLMAHVAGVRQDEGDEEPLLARCDLTTDGLQRFATTPLRFEPGTQFRYSPYGWILVSAAVEEAAREPFFTFMRARIFEPLGMKATRPDALTESTRGRATLYYPRFAADTRYGPEFTRDGDYSCFAGAGAFLSTPSDLVRYATAITNGTLLQPATVKLLQTPQRLTSGQETGYGLGWDLETLSLAGQSTTMAGHDDEFTIGGSASLATFPARGIVVAVMTNISFAKTSSLAASIAEAFAEQGNPSPSK
jgi:serine beta-lactamase-like protein LACTB, mitochondrial